MRFIPYVSAALLALVVLAPVGADETAVAEKPKMLGFGEAVEDLSGPGPDGKTHKLSDLTIDKARAEAAVMEVAKAYAGDQALTLATAVASLPGVQEDGEADDILVRELVAKSGRAFGLTVNDGRLERVKTLADIVAWILASKDAPVVVMVWSPRCPMCKGIYDERVVELMGETGLRMLVIAGSYPDKVEQINTYLDDNGYQWKVILDPEQKIVDRLGAKKTPHLFLFDKDLKLHYKGGVDDDPRGRKSDDERKEWFMDAVEAVVEGRDVPEADTPPPG